MKKGLTIAILVVLLLILGVLVVDALRGGVWIFRGLDGNDGKSAYQLALEDGYEGSLHDWLVSLAVKGDAGLNGKNGIDGKDGINGTDGKNGADGQNGVGVRDVNVNSDGHLLVTLTNGVVLDAGYVGGQGFISDETDEDGFTEVYEIVRLRADGGTEYLNLRAAPDLSSEVVTTASRENELLRVGINEESGWSRFITAAGKTAYAKSHYFEPKYIYPGALPEVDLPESVTLCRGVQSWFITGEAVPELPDGMNAVWSYSGAGEQVYDGAKAFAVTPSAAGSAVLSFRLEKRADGEWRTLYEKNIAVSVVEKNAGLTKTGILIGDSRISDGAIPDALAEDLPNLRLLGTRKTIGDHIPHEGRAGWSTSDYCTKASVNIGGTDISNAFYSASTGGFDFSAYMETNYPGEALDFVVINLGVNDGYSASSVENLKTMVASIRAYAAAKGRTVNIFIMTEYLSPADGYFLRQSYGTDVANRRDRQFAYNGLLNEAFGGRGEEHIFLLPNRLCLNFDTDRPMATVEMSSGSAERVTDIVHLSTRGYRKEAEMIEAYLFACFD